MDKMNRNLPKQLAEIRHIPERPLSAEETGLREAGLSIAAHFREQNALLQENNRSLSDKIQKLTNGVEALVAEMHGVRTGKKDEAFARICGVGTSPDLPTVGAEAALFYIYTAKQIGEKLGFHCSQIGLLLSNKGLGWAGNGDYQEIGRCTSQSQSKFWHREVPDRLRRILDENNPTKYGITTKGVLTIFKKWKERAARDTLLQNLESPTNVH